MPNLSSTAIIVTNSPVYLRVKISPQYHQQPLISKLVSDYQLVINITAALLTSSARDYGWFDLEILGEVAQINQALGELHSIGIEALLISPPTIPAPPVAITSSGVKEWRQFDLDRQSQNSQKSPDSSPSEEQNQSRKFQIRIPKEYRDIPVISTLILEYGLTVNIAAAILPFASLEDGWFELELGGSSAQLNNAIHYLKELNLGIY
jgi:ABC-type methionine transport system ATPase subunit